MTTRSPPLRDDAVLRVRAVLHVGARIADPHDPLGREGRARLVATSGLSPEGVELALCEHLETSATEAELTSFVAASGEARRCTVVLSANVCTAGLRAIALALAAAPDVAVKPSRRDPVIAELVVRGLGESGLEVGLVSDAFEQSADELHVYGSDATIAELRAKAPAGVVVRGHGTGLGVAVVGAGVDPARAATDLARDVVPFDQRGCLSPRFAFVDGDADAFARALSEALDLLGARVPRGPLDDATRAELAGYEATMQAVGRYAATAQGAVGVDVAPRTLLMPPAARVVHVVAASVERASELLAPFIPHVTSIGVAGGGGAKLSACAPGARVVPLGSMQHPPFDGPVDRQDRSA